MRGWLNPSCGAACGWSRLPKTVRDQNARRAIHGPNCTPDENGPELHAHPARSDVIHVKACSHSLSWNLPVIRRKVLAVKNTSATAVILLALCMSASGQQPTHGLGTYSVSPPHLGAAIGERVVSFEIHISAGEVLAVSNLPIGWYVVVDNDPSWQTKISGNARVGAASLDPDEFQKLRLVVKKDEFYLKFAVAGTASVTKDFQKERHVALKMSDFSVTAADHER